MLVTRPDTAALADDLPAIRDALRERIEYLRDHNRVNIGRVFGEIQASHNLVSRVTRYTIGVERPTEPVKLDRADLIHIHKALVLRIDTYDTDLNVLYGASQRIAAGKTIAPFGHGSAAVDSVGRAIAAQSARLRAARTLAARVGSLIR